MAQPGLWREMLNSDASIFGGSNVGNGGHILAHSVSQSDRRAEAVLTIPPLGALILKREEA